MYEEDDATYSLVDGGGTIADDRESISFEVDHFSTFAVFDTGSQLSDDEVEQAMDAQNVDDDDDDSSDTTSTTNDNQDTDDTADATPALSDVSEDAWYQSFVQELVDEGVVSGYPDGTFRPANPVNRAELAKIAATAFDLDVPDEVTTAPFSDVPTDAWFAPFVVAAKNAGISGYPDGTFRPDATINRAEALVLLLTAAGIDFSSANTSALPFSDVPTDAWFAPAVAHAYALDIVSGKTATTFQPSANITRAEIAKIAVMLMEMTQ